MAGKKPAKPMAGQSKQPVRDPEIYGIQVRYLGTPDTASSCVKCAKKTVRGMIRIKGDGHYCSVRCVTAV